MKTTVWKDYVIPTAAEFVGTALFQVLGGSAVQYPAFTNGLALMVLIYATSSLGSGHFNFWVTMSLLTAGHFSLLLSALFVVAQLAGAVAGAAMQLAVVPANNSLQLGCFVGSHDINKGQIVLIEALLVYTFLVVIHNVCVWRQSFAALGPLVIGATLTACALSGGYWTGGALNADRVLGAAIVNGCYWSVVWCYIVGQFCGTVFAVLTSVAVNGFGSAFQKTHSRLDDTVVRESPDLIRGSMAPATVSNKAASHNESRLAYLREEAPAALDSIVET